MQNQIHGLNPSLASPVCVSDLREAEDGIFYTNQPLVVIGQDIISFLKERALAAAKKRARLCVHATPEADQHEMLIVSHCETYVAPHRHAAKSESFLVIEGLAKAILFDEFGTIVKCVPMGPVDSGRPFFYRMPAGQFHSLAIESELLVFLETTKGPFVKTESENARWAPRPDELASGRAYIHDLVRCRD